MRRWLYRILIGLGVLILLVVVGLQIVFWTNLPRNLAIPIAQRHLGLRVECKSLSTGWLGHTTLKGVTLALPLDGRAFLEIPELKISHTSLFGIIFGRTAEVDSIELIGPKVHVRQNDAGHWNLQDVAESVAKTNTGPSEQEQSQTPLKLPEITIRQAQITVVTQSHEQVTIDNLFVHGRPNGALVYTYDAKVPGQLESQGRLVPGGDWTHQLSIQVQNVGDWVRPWIRQWPDPAMARLNWQGKVAPDGIRGRLTVEDTRIQQYSAKGVVDISGANGGVVVRPDGLSIEGGQIPGTSLVGGSAKLIGGVISLDGLLISTAGGLARLDGQYLLESQSADLKAAWDQVHFPSGVTQSGSLEANLTMRWPKQPHLDVTINSNGRLSDGGWDARMKLAAQGEGWNQMNWHLDFPRLELNGSRQIELNNLSADLRTSNSLVSLDSLKLPDTEKLACRGGIDLSKQTWWLWADGNNWILPEANDARVRFSVNTWGDFTNATVEQLYLQVGQLELVARGHYLPDATRPLNVNVEVEHPDRSGMEGRSPLRGRLWSQLNLSGKVMPLSVDVKGQLYGKGLQVYQRLLGDVAVELTGQINSGQGELHTTQLNLLGGRWRFDAMYPAKEQELRVAVSVDDLPLKESSALVVGRPVEGNLSGKWTINLPRLNPERMTMTGEFHAENVESSQFAAQSAEGKMRLDEGVLQVGPVVMRQDDGQISATATLRQAEENKAQVRVEASAWPLRWGDGRLDVWMKSNLDLNWKELTASGPLDLTAAASLGDKPLGKVELDADLQGRSAVIKKIGGDIFGGSIQGQARVDLDKPMQSRGQFAWSAIDDDQVAAVFPALDPLDGRFSGAVQFEPSEDARALEPFRVTGTIRSEGGHYRELQIGDVSFLIFVGIADRYSVYRAVLEHFDMTAGGGRIKLWARAGRHREGDFSAQVDLSFADLELDQLVHTARTTDKPLPGKLSGQMTAVGDPRDLERIYAEGGVKLTESDLAGVPGFTQLYNALHLSLGRQQPSGEGYGAFRIDGGTLSLLSARYFNRGIEAFASGSSPNIWSGKRAGLDYVIVGTARPLKNIDIPFFADMDSVLSILQSALTSMRVTGTVGQPKVIPMAFSELGGNILGVLLGETRSMQTTAGR